MEAPPVSLRHQRNIVELGDLIRVLQEALYSKELLFFMGKEQGDKGQEDKTSQVEVLERGHIFFFYRPKVEKEDPASLDDVQRLYVVLRPQPGEKVEEEKQSTSDAVTREVQLKEKLDDEKGGHKAGKRAKQDEDADDQDGKSKGSVEGGKGTEKVNIEKKPLLRFIIMGRKSLPDPKQRKRPFWGYVELVTTNTEDIKKLLAAEEYETATRGHRHKPAARPVGEGVYRILRHERGKHTHLVYRLELPTEDKYGEPQEALNIEREASYILQIKNPEQPAPPYAGLQNKRQATFPANLQGTIGSYRFVSADPPDFLNYEGCELILIAASDDIQKELGLDVEVHCQGKECSDLLQMLGENDSKNPFHIQPLLEGTWE